MFRRNGYLRRSVVGVVLLGAMSGAPQVAFAQQRAAAELLFGEGRKLMDKGRYDEACAKFEERKRLDRAPGTTWNRDNCEERRGRVASAWERYRAAVKLLAVGDKRRTFALEKIDALEAGVPRLRI